MGMDSKYLREGYDIKHIIKQFSAEYKINEASLDYSLSSYKTYLLKDDSVDLNVPSNITENTLKLVESNKINSYIDSPYKLVQGYVVEVFKRESSFYPIIINLQAEDDNTKLKAILDTSRIPSEGNLEAMIKSTILNICAYRGIVIGLGWESFNFDIKELANKLRKMPSHPPYYEIKLANLPTPKIKSIAVKRIISKDANAEALSHNSLLLSGGFFKVKKGELLMDYQKPIYESNWRDIYGKIYGIDVEYPIGTDAGDGIHAESANNKVHYYATKEGFVSIVSNVMQISDVVVLDNLNANNLENVKEQNITSLVVKNENLTKDIISTGLDIEIENLKIFGNVGAVNIKAKDLFIKGQIHIKSELKAQKASILHLKGGLVAKEAEIRFCENASVQCDNLNANTINGSKVYVTNGKVANVKSGNTFFVQKELIIDKMSGYNNEFVLYPFLYGDAKEKYEMLQTKIDNINQLKVVYSAFANKLQIEQRTNELLYNELSNKDASRINGEIFNWNKVLEKHKDKAQWSKTLLDKHNVLMSNFDEKITMINRDLEAQMHTIYGIKVVFTQKCNLDFYVRILGENGLETRHHINKSGLDIKMFKLENNNGTMKVACYRE